MEIVGRIVIGVAFAMALHLGLRVWQKKAGRGCVADGNNWTLVRAVATALIGVVVIWYLFLPGSIPGELKIAMPGWLRLIGIVLFIVGITLRAWSQMVLKEAWSMDLDTTEQQHFITSGPYSFMRHPIYASYFVILPGLFFITENWLLAGFGLVYVFASAMRVGAEEEMLREHFPDYDQYTKSTGRFLPYLGGRNNQ